MFGGFNFGGMPHGGMGGHGHGQSRSNKEVDNNKFYELLGVEKSATEAEIKKGFRKQAMQHHPDKGGDPEKFKEISKAYEILSNPDKKQIYDEMGEEGLEGGGGGGQPMDIFDLFGGGMFGGGGQSRQRGPKKGEDVIFPLKVSLDDLYNSTTKKLRLTKSVICTGCKGKGGKVEGTCKGCKGQGIRMVIRQLGPGMIQQMQTQCTECKGTGSNIPEKDKCTKCKGEKTIKEKKTLEVNVERGMKHQEKIVFRSEADEAPDTIPGDVVVVLQQQEHERFKRKGNHLMMTQKITLLEALTGFTIYVEQMDGRVIRVHSNKGDIIQPGTIKQLRNEGMPQTKNPYVRGDLYIEFEIVFPKSNSLTENNIKLLQQSLPKPENKPIPQPKKLAIDMHDDDGDNNNSNNNNNNSNTVPEIEEGTLHDVDIKNAFREMEDQQQREAYDEDDEEQGHRGGQAGCRAQ